MDDEVRCVMGKGDAFFGGFIGADAICKDDVAEEQKLHLLRHSPAGPRGSTGGSREASGGVGFVKALQRQTEYPTPDPSPSGG